MNTRAHRIARVLFGMVALLPMLVLTPAALADPPPPGYDCEGNAISQEEYDALLAHFSFLEALYGQVFETPFGGCDEGLLSLELSTEPQVGSFTAEFVLPLDAPSVPEGSPPWATPAHQIVQRTVEYCLFDQTAYGARLPANGPAEPFSLRVLDYRPGTGDTVVVPECEDCTLRIGSLWGWLDGPAGSLPVYGALYVVDRAGATDRYFQHIGTISDDMLSFFAHHRAILEDLMALGLPWSPYDRGAHCELAVESEGVSPGGAGQGSGGASADTSDLDGCLMSARFAYIANVQNAENSFYACKQNVTIASAALLAACLAVSAGLGCIIPLVGYGVAMAGCEHTAETALQNAQNTYDAAASACLLRYPDQWIPYLGHLYQ